MRAWRAGAATLLWLVAGAAGCGDAGHERLGESATAGSEPGSPATPGSPPADPPSVLPMVESEPVRGGLTGPGGEPFEVAVRTSGRQGHERRIGRETFTISLRSTGLVHDPCGSCHLPGDGAAPRERSDDAHQNIQPVHPADAAGECRSCHAADAVDRLALETGETVTLDHAYVLCAQCHFAQVDAWAAGVHGKRLDVWRGRRVMMVCADCHDPHRPALEKRIPYPGPEIPRGGDGGRP